ncbi:hypothetical protein Tco_0709265 [Tanacetum coccineum]
MKGAPECMRISGFMHRVNNPELTKRLNEHVPNTMEEMMIATTAFIRGEATAAGKKKGHASWRAQDHSGTEGPLVIEAEIGGHIIHRMYVDGGSSTEVLYEHCLNRREDLDGSALIPMHHRSPTGNQEPKWSPATTSLTGFSGETIWPLDNLGS